MNSSSDRQDLESRKVQLSGGSTFTVSLPKEWAREHGVDAGSELGLRPNGDGTLLVQVDTTASGSRPRPTVDVDQYDTIPLEVIVRGLYLAGYSEFALRGARATSSEGVRAVEAASNTLVGLTVEGVQEEVLVVRNALNPEYVSLRQTLRQLRRNACDGFQIAVEGALSGDPEEFATVKDRSGEAQRQFAIIQRSLQRSLVDHSEVDRLGETKTNLFDYYLAGRVLVTAGHEAERIVDVEGLSPDDQLSEELREYVGDIIDLLMAGTDILLTAASPTDVAALFDQQDRLRAQTTTLQSQLAERELEYTSTAARVQRAAERVTEEAETVVDVATQRALREHDWGTDGENSQ